MSDVRRFEKCIDCTNPAYQLAETVADALGKIKLVYIFCPTAHDITNLRQNRQRAIVELHESGFIFSGGWLYMTPRSLALQNNKLEGRARRARRDGAAALSSQEQAWHSELQTALRATPSNTQVMTSILTPADPVRAAAAASLRELYAG